MTSDINTMLRDSKKAEEIKRPIRAPEQENMERIKALENRKRNCANAFERENGECTRALKREHELLTLNREVSKKCETLREDMQKDVTRGAFHSQSYTLDFNDPDRKPLVDCERIADAVSAHLPGFGVTVGRAQHTWHCGINITHTITSDVKRAKYYFDNVMKDGSWASKYPPGYTGSDPASCRALANQLNRMNSIFNREQVVCKATVVRGMCRITMERHDQGFVQRLLNRIFN